MIDTSINADIWWSRCKEFWISRLSHIGDEVNCTTL